MFRLNSPVFKVDVLLWLGCCYIILMLLPQHGWHIGHYQLLLSKLPVLLLILPVMTAIFYRRHTKSQIEK